MRETNFWSLGANRASVNITTSLYDRRALDCTADRPLINSLNHLAYLTSSSARVRETLCSDGGLERLVDMLKDCLVSRRAGPEDSSLVGWKWTLALQCLLFLGTRGTEAIRSRLVEAGAIPVICTILDSFLRRTASPDEHKDQLPDVWGAAAAAAAGPSAPASAAPDAHKPTFDSGVLVPRDEDVVWALEILAFVSKYSSLKQPLQETHLLPPADNVAMQDEVVDYDSYDFVTSNDTDPEYLMPRINIFPIVEKFTARKDAREIPYWAGIIMRNSCRKDDKKGIRQCANFECGKWEDYPRHFAKCRRCKRTKYCSRACQLQAWSFHRYWCAPATSSASSAGVSIAEHSDRPQSRGGIVDPIDRPIVDRVDERH